MTSNLVVKGDRPFQILKIQCADRRLQFAWSQKSASLHPISMTFTAGAAPQISKIMARIETDDPAMPVVEAPLEVYVLPKTHSVSFGNPSTNGKGE